MPKFWTSCVIMMCCLCIHSNDHCHRHREIKKFEKNQDRIHHLRAIAHERGAVGRSRLAEAAASEADRLEMPWLASNLPIKPPIYASVSQGGNTSAKVSNLSAVCEAAKAHPKLDVKEETRSLDVLNLKVGYAVDAQYALPHEVCPMGNAFGMLGAHWQRIIRDIAWLQNPIFHRTVSRL